jgi:hypothetical protein
VSVMKRRPPQPEIVRAIHPRGTRPWNPTLAQEPRKDGAPAGGELPEAALLQLRTQGSFDSEGTSLRDVSAALRMTR